MGPEIATEIVKHAAIMTGSGVAAFMVIMAVMAWVILRSMR